MTATTRSASVARSAPAARPATPVLLRLLNGIASADMRFRERQKLGRLADHRLEDMGLVRRADGRITQRRD